MQNQTTSDSWQQLLEMPRKSWWARLPFGVRMAAGASAVLALIGGGVVGVAALSQNEQKEGPRIVTEVGVAAPAPSALSPAQREPSSRLRPKNTYKADERVARPAAPVPASTTTAAPADRTNPVSAPASPSPQPVQTTRTEVETREIPYETRLVRDPALPRGAKKVETQGVPGVETLHYLVTLTDGRPTDRKLIDAVVTRQPQHKVVALGTQNPRRPAHSSNCGEALNFCVPLGRHAICPGDGREEDATVPMPDLVLSSDDLGYLEGLAC